MPYYVILRSREHGTEVFTYMTLQKQQAGAQSLFERSRIERETDKIDREIALVVGDRPDVMGEE